MSEKFKIFISYNHATGYELAKMFRDIFIEKGYDCWFDEDKIEFGNDIVKKMEEGVTNCDAMILLISSKYLASKNCMFEAELAGKRNKFRIPILLENITWPIEQLERYYPETMLYAKFDLVGKENKSQFYKSSILFDAKTIRILKQVKEMADRKMQIEDEKLRVLERKKQETHAKKEQLAKCFKCSICKECLGAICCGFVERFSSLYPATKAYLS